MASAPVSVGHRSRLDLVRRQIVEDHNVAGMERRHQELLDVSRKTSPVIGPSSTSGATMPVSRRPATKVVVRQWPCGALSTRRSLRGPQP